MKLANVLCEASACLCEVVEIVHYDGNRPWPFIPLYLSSGWLRFNTMVDTLSWNSIGRHLDIISKAETDLEPARSRNRVVTGKAVDKLAPPGWTRSKRSRWKFFWDKSYQTHSSLESDPAQPLIRSYQIMNLRRKIVNQARPAFLGKVARRDDAH
jgi:hypothetical protein